MGEGPGETPSALRCASYLINNLLTDIKQLAKTSKGATLSAFFIWICQKICLSLLYFNKLYYPKSSERSSLVTGPRLNSSLGKQEDQASHSKKKSTLNTLWKD